MHLHEVKEEQTVQKYIIWKKKYLTCTQPSSHTWARNLGHFPGADWIKTMALLLAASEQAPSWAFNLDLKEQGGKLLHANYL